MISTPYKIPRQCNHGFSLVELLVVIGIIGILVAIVYANFAQGKASTRDKVRQTTLADIQLSIEQYKAQTGSYPKPQKTCGDDATDDLWATSDPALSFTGAELCVGGEQMIAGLVPTYISSLPNPTRPDGRGYYYRSDGNAYKLIVYEQAETHTITSFNQEFAACPVQEKGTGGGVSPLCQETSAGSGVPVRSRTYAVYSLGAEGW